MNDDFSFFNPRLMAQADSDEPDSKLVEFRILKPDCTLHSLQLPVNCTGSDCMDEVNVVVVVVVVAAVCLLVS